jgi:hypothetical protein
MNSRIIMGSAIGLAAIAVALDHTRHKLPQPEEQGMERGIIIMEEGGESPCGLGSSPCGMDADTSPCGL